MNKNNKQIVGILGHGEIGSAIARICREARLKVLIRELTFDQIKDQKVDFLHVNIPQKDNRQFVDTIVRNIKQLSPGLTIINSSVQVGTCRKIQKLTGADIIHSPVIGVHPHLYESIKFHFRKIIGPVNKNSLKKANLHFKTLKLKTEIFDCAETTEAAKLLDLVRYGWDIIFCKWIKEVCGYLDLNFDQVYTKYNKIYNKGYSKLRPNVKRPMLIPIDGPIGGHCTIEGTILFDKTYSNRFTKFILEEQKKYFKETKKEPLYPRYREPRPS